MKKVDIKSAALGLIVGVVGVVIIFTVVVRKPITANSFNNEAAYSLKQSSKTSNNQNTSKDSVITYNTSNTETNDETTKRIQKGMEITADDSDNEVDAEAIETMKKTGNWSYVEKSFPRMTNDGIGKVVEIYNSKHSDTSQYKNASDYIKK
ncbi:hypothetical protein [Clostridium hydrogenum]|uniref:hypothetical protein n=1 Tax=Clostridium hydrogenum TaxID=2855764 RepID=UPI001F37E6FB|nr:hypothetical protein [Clostridium hydrogenum]